MLSPEQIDQFNPINLKNLNPEDVAVLSHLKDEELKQLADAYPSVINGQAYLVLNDAAEKVNRRKLSTYPILYNLRTKHGQKNLTIAGYAANINTTNATPTKPIAIGAVKDLTANEVANAEGLSRGKVQEIIEIDPESAAAAKAELLEKIAAATTVEELYELVPGDTADAELSNAAMQRAEAIRGIPKPGPVPAELKPVQSVTAAIKKAKSIDEIDALIIGDTRPKVLESAAAAKAELA